MPPVTKAGGNHFRKDVDFVAKDDDEQVAAGIVMVPDKADLQNDFAREETIRGFADQFETFVEGGEAGGGIMHAVFPGDWMTLERNEVLAETAEIGDESVQAGAWVQEWAIENDALWGLIDDGILEGYSIGAVQVQWDGPFEQDADAVADIAVPDALAEDELIWELTDGLIREVSAVDIPAVPDAQILEAKGADKRLADHLGNQGAFIDEAMERGHSEAEAERLWTVLNDAMEIDGAGEPGKSSVFRRAGKAFLSALTHDEGADAVASSDRRVKEGQTLSQANRESAMAAVDANLELLADAGVETPARFTDREDVDFDLSEHEARAIDDGMLPFAASQATKGEALGSFLADAVADAVAEADEDVDEDDIVDDIASTAGMDRSTIEAIIDGDIECPPIERLEAFAEHVPATVAEMVEAADEDGCEYDVQSSKHASGGDTPGDDQTTMSDDDPMADAPDWAKALHDDIQENSERIDEALERQRPKTAEIQIDGETYEVREDAAKAALGVDDDVDVEEAIERLNEKADRVDAVEQRLDTITQQSGVSTQLGASRDGEGDDESGLDDLGKALS